MKPKKCKECSSMFTPSRPMQIVCGPICAQSWGRKLIEREDAKAKREEHKSIRAAREKAKTRGDHLREVQAVFNLWVRLRDIEEPCISCGRPASWGGQWDAGHYRSRGTAPALRFEPVNVHKQCLPCNRHLSGNLIEYRLNLIAKIGQERVDWLEGPHEAKKLTVARLQEMKLFYRAEIRRLEAPRKIVGRTA